MYLLFIKPKRKGSKALRTARYGKYAGREFFSCSGYPKCNYIKNLE